jgi:hypothetical protein
MAYPSLVTPEHVVHNEGVRGLCQGRERYEPIIRYGKCVSEAKECRDPAQRHGAWITNQLSTRDQAAPSPLIMCIVTNNKKLVSRLIHQGVVLSMDIDGLAHDQNMLMHDCSGARFPYVLTVTYWSLPV